MRPAPAAIRATVQGLPPAYFALVMATGIVSIDLRTAHHPGPSAALLWVCAASYVVLLGLTAWRIVAFHPEMARDMHDPHRAFGYFTFTAGTHVLGTRLALDGHLATATVLLAVGTLSWIFLGYAVPWNNMLSRPGDESLSGADGSWFILVVGGQSIAVLASTLEQTAGTGRDLLALVAVIMWCVSICLYGAVAVIVALRLLFFPARPRDLTPPYWVAMGATAITTVAGSQIAAMTPTPAAIIVHGFAIHVSLVFWSFGTWLYPALVIVGWWRHIRHRVPLRYGPGWWSIVFPLGMYAAASHDLGQVTKIPELLAIGGIQTWIGLTAWFLAFATLLSPLVFSLAPARARKRLIRLPPKYPGV